MAQLEILYYVNPKGVEYPFHQPTIPKSPVTPPVTVDDEPTVPRVDPPKPKLPDVECYRR
jgi:hypothetical protein